jgi:hypothetical protein
VNKQTTKETNTPVQTSGAPHCMHHLPLACDAPHAPHSSSTGGAPAPAGDATGTRANGDGVGACGGGRDGFTSPPPLLLFASHGVGGALAGFTSPSPECSDDRGDVARPAAPLECNDDRGDTGGGGPTPLEFSDERGDIGDARDGGSPPPFNDAGRGEPVRPTGGNSVGDRALSSGGGVRVATR